MTGRPVVPREGHRGVSLLLQSRIKQSNVRQQLIDGWSIENSCSVRFFGVSTGQEGGDTAGVISGTIWSRTTSMLPPLEGSTRTERGEE